MTVEYHYSTPEGTFAVRIARADSGYRVTLGEKTYSVAVRGARAGVLDLDIDGKRLRAHTAEEGSRRFVQTGPDGPFTFTRAEKRSAARRAKAAGEESLTANMHGQVAAVLVKEGDLVERGATLVVLEAMKMELRVVAPHDGRVKLLACKVGEVVERGRVLAEIEPIAKGPGAAG